MQPRCGCAPGATGSRRRPRPPRRRGSEAAAHAGRARGRARADRDPRLDRVVALLRARRRSPTAIRRCEAIRERGRGQPRGGRGRAEPLAGLHAMEGRFDEARELLAAQRRRVRGARADAQLGRVAPRRDRGAARRRRGRRRAHPAHGVRGARGDGRPGAALDDGGVPRRRRCSPRARDDEAERFAEISAELAATTTTCSRRPCGAACGRSSSRGAAGSTRPSSSRGRRWRWPRRPTS